MNSPQLAVSGIAAVAIQLMLPAVGVWNAQVDLDLPSTQPLPSGAVTMTIGTTTLKGTVDPDSSGRFAEKAKLRVMGGAAGWSKTAKVQHFKSDAGLKSNAVISATAAAVGETVNEPNPLALSSADFVRMVGDLGTEPASRVLLGRVWYVDADGITQVVDARPTAKPTSDVEVLAWDPDLRLATLAASAIVWPGTVLTDARFGTATIRDVVQSFDAAGSRVQAFCATTEASQVVLSLTRMVEEFGQLSRLRTYEYRVTEQNSDGRLYLQAVRKSAGVPDLLPIPVWPSAPGMAAQFTPGTKVMIAFGDGDGRWPRVIVTDGTKPISITFDATTKVQLGDETAEALAHSQPVVNALQDIAITAEALAGMLATPPTSTVFVAFSAVASTQLTLLQTQIDALLQLIPTTKVVGQ